MTRADFLRQARAALDMALDRIRNGQCEDETVWYVARALAPFAHE